MVAFSVQTLMLDKAIESLLVGTDAQVLLYVFLFLLQLVFVEPTENLVRLLALLVLQAINLRLSSFLIVRGVLLRIEIFRLCCRSAKRLDLAAKGV